jgi:hypothetical protein
MLGLYGRLGFDNSGGIVDYTLIHIGPNASRKSVDVWCYADTVDSDTTKALVDDSGLGFSGGFRFAQLNNNVLVPPGIYHRYLGAEATDGTEIWNLRSGTNDIPVLTINGVMNVEDGSQTPSTGTRGTLYAIHAETRELLTTLDSVYTDTGGHHWLNVQNITFIDWAIDASVTIHGFMYGTDPNSPQMPDDGHRLVILKTSEDAYELVIGGNIENIINAYGDWKPIRYETNEYIYDRARGYWFKMDTQKRPRQRLTSASAQVYTDSGGHHWLNVQYTDFIDWAIDASVTIHGFMYGTNPDAPGLPDDGHRLVILKTSADIYELVIDGGHIENIISAWGDWTPIRYESTEYIYDRVNECWIKMGFKLFP